MNFEATKKKSMSELIDALKRLEQQRDSNELNQSEFNQHAILEVCTYANRLLDNYHAALCEELSNHGITLNDLD